MDIKNCTPGAYIPRRLPLKTHRNNGYNMKAKRLATVVVTLAALVAVGWLFLPEERLTKLMSVIAKARSEPGELCLDYERRSLDDPDAAKLRSASETHGGRTVNITYSAKNAYGAYVSAEATCELIDGKIDSFSTQGTRLRSEMDKHLNCLRAKKRDLDASDPNVKSHYEDCVRNLMPMQ